MRTPTGVERDRSSRRALLAHSLGALAAVTAPHHARAIVNGAAVTDAEAASTGTVGLYIDLEGCQVCRKGVPATCTGTLVAPDLVLSAKHCIDVPRDLNGTLTRVVFASDMLKAGAPSIDVERYVTTSDYGIETAGNDLVLIKLKRPAPAGWRVAELPLGLLPEKAEFEEARRAGSPFFPDGLGFPTVTTYGYGQQSSEGTVDIAKYKAGELKRIDVDVRSEVRPYAPAFLTTPVNKKAGTCAGDSGGPALVVTRSAAARASCCSASRRRRRRRARATRRSSSTRTPSARFCSRRARSWARRCGRRSAGATTPRLESGGRFDFDLFGRILLCTTMPRDARRAVGRLTQHKQPPRSRCRRSACKVGYVLPVETVAASPLPASFTRVGRRRLDASLRER